MTYVPYLLFIQIFFLSLKGYPAEEPGCTVGYKHTLVTIRYLIKAMRYSVSKLSM